MIKKVALIFSLLLMIALIMGGYVAFKILFLMPVFPRLPNHEEQVFQIPKGQSISVIAQRLTEAKLIHHPFVFRLLVIKDNKTTAIQAGSFKLSPKMTPQEILAALSQGTDDTWIKILEGWRVEEIAQMLDETEGLESFDKDEFLELSKDDEGTLYPDSYLVQKTATAQEIHRLLKDTFQKKVLTPLQAQIDSSDRKLEDILIMASLVQRETGQEEEMKTVAGVLWNRVEVGMSLDVDATLQYIAGYSKTQQSWWVPPNIEVKKSTSLFNTYARPGLPPRPICNPGLAAVQAALSPTDSDYIFYLHDNDGVIHYGVTLDEHNRNVQKYLR